MTGTSGEMSFLEHLEELRMRVIRSLLAVVGGFGIGAWAVDRFDLINVIKRPIAPYIPSGKLVILSPTEPVIIVLKLSLYVGLVIASPVILYQIWAFLSPALYSKERRLLVPSLAAGAVLFFVGAALGYAFVVPPTLKVLLSFEASSFTNMITYQEYFSFVVHLVLALGLSFELPLVIIILASVGLVTPRALNKFRKMAIILAMVAGAALSPSPDVVTMLIMTAPLIVLYEVGFLGTVIVSRRRARRAAAATAILFCFVMPWSSAGRLDAQLPLQRPAAAAPRGANPADTGAADTTRGRRPGQPMDTAQARRLGLPTGPSGSFLPADSITSALLARPGFVSTRFRSDSATLFAREKRIRLFGQAATERDSSTLEAHAIDYEEDSCVLDARGDPKLFGNGTVLVAEGLRYDTCRRRAVVSQALTNFQENGANWFLRGDLAQDSSSARLYAASSAITSCDLPVPHYHFQARQVKWISKQVMVARPAVLFIRDVPILWLPFIFQDARPGRHSGILIPRFGLSDIVRPTPSFSRSVANVGYYWAPNDYMDLTGRIDWYAGRYFQYGVAGQYNWLDRFTRGSFGYSRQIDEDGSTGTQLNWDHTQNFDLSTSLRVSLAYVAGSQVVSANSVDPLLTTRQITSSANFSKRFGWGTIALGGNRRQNLNDGSVTQEFPAITIIPAPFQLSPSITWSPTFSFTQDRQTDFPTAGTVEFLPGGGVDTTDGRLNSRTTSLNFDTPLRFGNFTWRNSVSYLDQVTDQRQVSTFRRPSLVSPDPNDSVTVSQAYAGSFSTGIDWQTGINLPILFRGSWKLQPSVGIANATSAGPFLLRNRFTNGGFVEQGKRLQFSLSAAPSIFGFFNHGIGPIARIRHTITPLINFSYSPEASVPLAYATAIASPGQAPQLTSLASELVSVSLNQIIEAKEYPAPGDTSAEPQVKKFKLLSINTSPMSYDFEQAKLPHRTGWVTSTLTNTFQTDLLPGFNASLTHDLWSGQVGTDSARFDPYLTNVSLGLSITGATFRSIGQLLGLVGPDTTRAKRRPSDAASPPPSFGPASPFGMNQGGFGGAGQFGRAAGGPFSANFQLTISRPRPVTIVDPLGGGVLSPPTKQENLTTNLGFSPTPLWSVSASSQYDIVANKFSSYSVALQRNLHEWKAAFTFTQNANGNFAFFFSVFLVDLPSVKFDYNQTTLQPQTSP
ncbi:MAG: twin-arginine translocase subunit TatC [Gemmatimonadales bacterium]